MGTMEQTPHRGSHRTSRREKEGQGKGVSVGRWAKETLRPRKGIERNTEETWDDHRHKGHRASGDRPAHRE